MQDAAMQTMYECPSFMPPSDPMPDRRKKRVPSRSVVMQVHLYDGL